MKVFVFVVPILAMLCFTSACTYWYQQGKSFEGCAQDLQQCYDELTKYADMGSIDSYEVDFIKHCMEQKGYTLLLENDLPLLVKRRDPAMSTFWLLAGVSGTVEE